MMRVRHAALTLCCSLFLLAISAPLQAQDATELPANWKELPVEQLVAITQTVYKAGNLDGQLLYEVQEHATELLNGIDLNTTTIGYDVIYPLFWAAHHNLQADQLAGIRETLVNKEENWQGKSYENVRGKYKMMERLRVPFERRVDEMKQWAIAGGDPAEVRAEDIPRMRHVFGGTQTIEGSFSVRWEGTIIAPQSGSYKFSVGPFDVNASHGDFQVQQTINVSVAGQSVISATSDNWNTQSQAVSLTANQPVALQYDIIVKVPSSAQRSQSSVLNALLFWEGPGIAKSIVPADRFHRPQSELQGLKATYSWTAADGTTQSVVRTDGNIDFAWASGRLTVASLDEPNTVDASTSWSQVTTATFLDDLASNGKRHPFLATPRETVEALSSSQREAFAQILLERPVLLDALDAEFAVEFYRAFRFGAADTALDVFGMWATRNASCECKMPHETALPGMDLDAREAYRELSVCVAQQHPEHLDILRNTYLELEDGTCCLPVAYTLSYACLSLGQFAEWTEFLDLKASDQGGSGDLRVNWLLARAHAHEIRLGPTKPYARVKHRVMDSRGYLDTAAIVAASPAKKVLVAKEIAARLSAVRRFDEARDMLDQIAAPADRVADVAAWRNSVDELQAAHAAQEQKQAEQSRTRYLETLQRRRSRAATAGNSDAVSRYDALIEAAGSQ